MQRITKKFIEKHIARGTAPRGRLDFAVGIDIDFYAYLVLYYEDQLNVHDDAPNKINCRDIIKTTTFKIVTTKSGIHNDLLYSGYIQYNKYGEAYFNILYPPITRDVNDIQNELIHKSFLFK